MTDDLDGLGREVSVGRVVAAGPAEAQEPSQATLTLPQRTAFVRDWRPTT